MKKNYRNLVLRRLFDQVDERNFILAGSSPLLQRDKNGELFVAITEELLAALKFLLRGVNTILHCKKANFFFNVNDGRRISIRNHQFEISDLEYTVINEATVRNEILSYRYGETVLNSLGQSLGISDETMICVPVGLDGSVFGALLFAQPKAREQFSEQDEFFLEALSETFALFFDHSAIMDQDQRLYSNFFSTLLFLLEKSYLFQSLNRNRATLEEVIKVSKLINSSTDIESLLLSILNSAKLVLNAESSSLLMIDEDKNELYFNNVAGEKEEELKDIRVPLGTGIAGIVAEKGEPLIINDAPNDQRVFKNVDSKTNYITRNLICVPLRVQKKIIGVIEVLNSKTRSQFTKADLNLFMSFADHAALAINNRDLIDNLQSANLHLEKKVNELSTLFRVSMLLAESKTEQEIFDNVVRIICEKLNIRCSAILVRDNEKNYFRISSQYGLPWQLAEAGTLVTNDAQFLECMQRGKSLHWYYADEPRPKWLEPGIARNSFLALPLQANKRKFGVIIFSDKLDGSNFLKEDREIIQTIINQITKGYENILLNADLIENEALKREIETSKKIQTAILPHKIPEIGGLDMYAISEPALQVGGDFYDFIKLGEGKLGICIADVSGKSLPAALFMASTSSIIRTLAINLPSPQQLLQDANDLVYQNSQSGMFVTLFYLSLDIHEMQIQFSSAGHDKQILLRKNGEIHFLQAKGAPLGILPNELHGAFGMGFASIEQGDILIFYTDGVIEAVNRDAEEFGMERFLAEIQKNRSKSAQQIVEKVFQAVNTFAGLEPQFDDFTMVVVRIL